MSIKKTPAIAKAMIQSNCHLGSTFVTTVMKKYIYASRPDDNIQIFDIQKTWTKLIQAAACICSLDEPSDVVVLTSKEFGKRAVKRFASLTGATCIPGRYIPGSFTNRTLKAVKEPRLIICLDPLADKNSIVEAANCNTTVICFANSDSELNFVDLAIPMNNRSQTSIATGFYLLSNLVRYMKGQIDTVDEDLVNGIESFIFREKEEMIEIAKEYEQNAEKEVEFL